MVRRSIVLKAVLAGAPVVGLVNAASAITQVSFENGTNEGFQQSFSASPNYSNRVLGGFGATDGNTAYDFSTAPGSYTFGDEKLFNFSPSSPPEERAKFDAFVASNLLLIDITVQGERNQPINPGNAHFVSFFLDFNGPSQAGGFVKSNESVFDGQTGEVGNAASGFATEYYSDARTRTLTWDYVRSGYNFGNLTPTETSQNYTLLNVAQGGASFNGTVQAAFDNIRVYRARTTDPTYNGGAAANWGTAGTFSNGTPNAVGAIAVFKARPDTNVTVTLESAKTVGSIVLDNIPRTGVLTPTNDPPTNYNFVGTSALTLQAVGTGEASIVVISGSNSITAPLAFASDAVIDTAADATTGFAQGVPSGASSLTIGNATIAAGKTLRKTSVGALTINGDVIGAAGSTVTIGGGKTTLAGTGHHIATSNLNVATSSQLDLTRNFTTVDYTGTSPLGSLTAAIKSGFAGGAQSGMGIVTSTPGLVVGIAEASSLTLTGGAFLGQAVDSTSVVIRVTLSGDADLNGIVNFDDLVPLAQNYNTPAGGTWRLGDFTYDGVINFDDLVPLAQNYNKSLSASETAALGNAFVADFQLARALVPEPTLLASLGGLLLMGRKRRA